MINQDEFNEIYEEPELAGLDPIMQKTVKYMKRLFDTKALQDKLSIIAFYIVVFESFKDAVEENLHSFLCTPIGVNDEGQTVYKESEDYEKEVLGQVLDNYGTKGFQDPLKATMLWLRRKNAISFDDFGEFQKIRKLRNKYAHEKDYLFNGVSMEDYQRLKSLLDLYKKIDYWFFVNIDGPSTLPDELIEEGVENLEYSSPLISMFETMAISLNLI